MPSGYVAIDAVTDEQFIKLVQIKDQSAGKLFFAPGQNVTPGAVSIEPGKPATHQGFTGINLRFGDSAGAKFAAQVLEMLAT